MEIAHGIVTSDLMLFVDSKVPTSALPAQIGYSFVGQTENSSSDMNNLSKSISLYNNLAMPGFEESVNPK